MQTRYAVWLTTLLWLTSNSISVEAQQRREEIKPPIQQQPPQRREEIKPPIQPPAGMPGQGQPSATPPMERRPGMEVDMRKQRIP